MCIGTYIYRERCRQDRQIDRLRCRSYSQASFKAEATHIAIFPREPRHGMDCQGPNFGFMDLLFWV